MSAVSRIRGSNRLTALKVAKTKGPALLIDGNGLQLVIDDRDNKRWSCRITIGGKRINRGLGPYPDVSLDDARHQAENLRRAARDGRDLVNDDRNDIASRRLTFRDAFERYFEEVKRPTLKPGRFAERWPDSMVTFVYPHIGNRPVAEITPAEIIGLLQPIWHTKRETATRVLQRTSLVFKSAIVRGDRVSGNPCEGVREELGKSRPKVTHRRALPWQDVPAFTASLEQSPRVTLASKLALLFVVHTACRSEEVRGALWSEINLGSREWTVPASRMKMKREHVVPLSGGAMSILKRAKVIRRNDVDLIFASRAATLLSDNTLSKLMRDAEVAGTPHGFRTSFKVWASENGIRDEVSEAVLAHGDPDKVRAAYRRTTFIDDRRAAMQAWSDYINRVTTEPSTTPLPTLSNQ